MDGLCELFSAVAGVGELLSRKEDKFEELKALSSSVQSISMSVRTFADTLAADERDVAFNSNSVFAQMGEHLALCKDVVQRQRRRQAATQDTDAPALEGGSAGSTFRSVRKSIVAQGSRTIREGLEVLNGKLGVFGAALPEDELEIMRKAGVELNRLVPQLTLAVSVFRPRGQKRSCDGIDITPSRPDQRIEQESWRRSSRRSVDFPTSEAAHQLAQLQEPADDLPLLRLQLVSDHPATRSDQLQELTTADMRPLGALSSSSSLDLGQAANPPAKGDDSYRRLAFGRLEIRQRIPATMTLTAAHGRKPEPLWRFVSKELFALDVPLQKPSPDDLEDSMNCQTLVFGGEGSVDDAAEATLAWGADDLGALPELPASKKPAPWLAEVVSLRPEGIHVRAAGLTSWTWIEKEAKVPVRQGDRIAILLESPPGSSTPSPGRNLTSEEATCLLGVELFPPRE